MKTKRIWLLGALAGTLLSSTALLAQTPASTRPLKIVTPYGGALDALAREVAEKMSDRLGRPVVVESRPGANGILGVQAVAKSTDGDTLLFTNHSPIVVNPLLYPSVDRSPMQGLTPVGMVALGSYVLVAHPSTGIKTVGDLIAKARENPGKISYASYGVGSGPHLCVEMLQSSEKIKLLHVPYKSGSTTDLVAGQVNVAVEAIATAVPFIKEGRLNALGFTDQRRTDVLPEVPAVRETIPGYRCENWVAVFAPASMKGTPLLKQVSDVLRQVVALPEISRRMNFMGVEPRTSSPDELADIVSTDLRRWGTVIRDAGVKVE